MGIRVRKGGRRLGLGVSSRLGLYVGFIFAGLANPDAIITSWLFPATADLASPADDATERLAGSGDMSAFGRWHTCTGRSVRRVGHRNLWLTNPIGVAEELHVLEERRRPPGRSP